MCGMVVTGSLSLLPRVFNGASDALERDADGEKGRETDKRRECLVSCLSFDPAVSQ
jgi:hypothetical protein